MKAAYGMVLTILVAGCGSREGAKTDTGGKQANPSLAEARRGFQTKLVRQDKDNEPVDVPPAQLFQVVRYESPAGKLAAYLSPDPGDGKKHPAIIWIFGGFSNGIGDTAWVDQKPQNDQSASAFRKAGILMMYPSLRGGNNNPGFREGFFGEVDDVLAATDLLAKQKFVDPQRIYLGGHSTGGTLALLTAACTDRYRAVFSFGPVDDVAGYGPDALPFDLSNPRERELRAPRRWLHSIRSPVFVFEGKKEPGNSRVVETMLHLSTNPLVHFHLVNGADHFSIIAPVTRLIATRILADTGTTTNIAFTEQELNGLFGR